MAFKNGIIDLRSDTVTQPTREMREAMGNAVVGDDVYGEDPTINKLENLSANIAGKEASLFVASGTMGNLIAVLTHCGRGDEAIMGHLGHTFLHEAGGISALGGIFPHVIQNQKDGTLGVEDVKNAFREEDVHHPESRLVIVENTQNACGGIPITTTYMKSLKKMVREFGLLIHLDGARIFNAAIALGTTADKLTEDADSTMFCLSKGLCAPVGSMLCGSKEFIGKARKIRKQLGGGMRQAGILAAAGLVALEKMTNRLCEDHERAKKLANGLMNLPGLEFDKGTPITNMVFLQLKKDVKMQPMEIKSLLSDEGIYIGQSGPRNFRLVTHYWVNEADIEKTIVAFKNIFER